MSASDRPRPSAGPEPPAGVPTPVGASFGDAFSYRRTECHSAGVLYPTMVTEVMVRLESPGVAAAPGCVQVLIETRGGPRDSWRPDVVYFDLFDHELEDLVAMLAGVVARARADGTLAPTRGPGELTARGRHALAGEEGTDDA